MGGVVLAVQYFLILPIFALLGEALREDASCRGGSTHASVERRRGAEIRRFRSFSQVTMTDRLEMRMVSSQ